jgi:hypothetical protein
MIGGLALFGVGRDGWDILDGCDVFLRFWG